MCPMLTNQTSRFLGGGRLAAPVPVLGAELLTNGDFETWTTDTNAGSWTESAAGTSTITRNDTDEHAGVNCAAFAVDGSNSSVYVLQGSTTVGQWYLFSIWGKLLSGAATVNFGKLNEVRTVPLTSSYAQYYFAYRATVAGGFITSRGSAANASYVVDDFSAKEITLASMFSTRPYTTHATTKAQCTIVAGTRAGVVANLDSASAPGSFVIASHDGTSIRLTKAVAGTYTELLTVTVAYVAGAFVEIRRLASTNTYQLFYDGVQRGADQTIADAQIVSNVLAGYFNTFSGNSLTGFSCIPSA